MKEGLEIRSSSTKTTMNKAPFYKQVLEKSIVGKHIDGKVLLPV